MRSKSLLTANILSTLYSAVLLYIFGGAIIAAGGISYVKALYVYFEFAFNILGSSSVSNNFLVAIIVLLIIHIVLFLFGCLFGWIAFGTKKSGLAKFSATLYLIGTIFFPIYLIFGLPITIVGYIGGAKQKKINKVNQQQI